MYEWLLELLEKMGLGNYAKTVTYVSLIILLFVACFIIRYITKLIIVKISSKVVKTTKTKWDDLLLKYKFPQRLSNLIFPVLISIFTGFIPVYQEITTKIGEISIILTLLLLISSFINAVDEIYRSYEISKIRPIKSLLQVVKITIYVISIIILIAMLLGKSPLVLIGGIGAMTAVTGIIFKDPILGFTAGIQLTYNDQIRIGDWIEVPKYFANGTVVELTMTTIKVQNFDKTITSIPAYALVSDSFINWRGMTATGGRRIKRQIFIDVSGVRICDDEMIEKYKKIHLINKYIEDKLADISEHNLKNNADMSEPINGRCLTNIGTFRVYALEYLKSHPGIHRDMIAMVRQLEAGETGVPLEIYAFTNTVEWVEYENIQSDIFDHLYSAAEKFGLSIYQQPSGADIRSLGNK